MSYLGGPRLVFAGQFQADVSTVNNDPLHFDNATFTPNDQQPGQGTANGWWNPTGTGAWRLIGCTVKAVVYADGTTCDDPSVDPVVGLSIESVNPPFQEGKLVDLDTEQQMVSEIWALKVNLVGTGLGFTSTPRGGPVPGYLHAGLPGWPRFLLWGGLSERPAGDPVDGRGDVEVPPGAVRWRAPAQLSIKFNVSGFNDSHTPITFPDGSPSLNFTFGKVVGSIGPYGAGEPLTFVAGRQLAFSSDALQNLQAQNQQSGVFPSTAYAVIVGDRLSLDLGNALYTTSPGGTFLDVGTLELGVAASDGTFVRIGAIPYTNPGWFESTAGIVSFTLTSAQQQAAGKAPLVVRANGTPLLSEPADGVFLRADAYVFRLDPGDPPASTTFTFLTFGVPTPNQQISIALDAAFSGSQPPIGTPTSALSFDSSVTTGPDGTASLSLTPSDPGNPRGFIDGQVYSLIYGPGASPPPPGSVGNPSRCLNVLVWSGYSAPATPTWTNDVQPIFQQYANLYPVMKQYVDLSSKADVVAKAGEIEYVFGVDPTQPMYMPVTRDLSPTKKAMILQWLAAPNHP